MPHDVDWSWIIAIVIVTPSACWLFVRWALMRQRLALWALTDECEARDADSKVASVVREDAEAATLCPPAPTASNASGPYRTGVVTDAAAAPVIVAAAAAAPVPWCRVSGPPFPWAAIAAWALHLLERARILRRRTPALPAAGPVDEEAPLLLPAAANDGRGGPYRAADVTLVVTEAPWWPTRITRKPDLLPGARLRAKRLSALAEARGKLAIARQIVGAGNMQYVNYSGMAEKSDTPKNRLEGAASYVRAAHAQREAARAMVGARPSTLLSGLAARMVEAAKKCRV